MAELDAPGIPTAAQQYRAIAWMQLRVFFNSFRRGKSSASLIAKILAWLLIVWVVCVFTVGVAFLFGVTSYTALGRHHTEVVTLLLWVVFALWQFFSINSTTVAALKRFDPGTLIRFPLTYPRFLAVTFISSVLTIGMLLATFIFLSMTAGIGLADPSLTLRALVAFGLFGLFNLLLSRALQSWVSRWLSTRLAREIFTLVSVLIVIGVQVVRFRFFSGPMINSYHAIQHSPYHALFAVLPPALATGFLFDGSFSALAGLVLCIFIAFGLYSWRVRRQFYGEDLNESPAPRAKARSRTAAPLAIAGTGTRTLSPLMACLQKEWIGLRRNTALIYSALMPLAFVLIFSVRGRLFAQHPEYALLMSTSYALLNLLAAGYNLFGAEGTGFQLFLFAPGGPRQMVLAKNIILLSFLLLDAAIAILIVLFMAHAHPAPITLATTAAWVLYLSFGNLAVGILRSIYSPAKIDLTKISVGRRNQTGRGSSNLIAIAMTMGNAALGIGVVALSRFLGYAWLPLLVFSALAIAALVFYLRVLNRVEDKIYAHSEKLMDVLCRS